MTDRELLEQAAKAAGYWNWTYNCYMGPAGWNPLSNDTHALKLAVRLLPWHVLSYSPEDYACCGEDALAATRRAIVGAAAKLYNNDPEAYQ